MDWLDSGHISMQIYTHTAKDAGQLHLRLKNAQVVVVINKRTALPRGVLVKLPKLRLVIHVGAIDMHNPHLDVKACTDLGIAVVHHAGGFDAHATAELTWALLMAAARRIPHYIHKLQKSQWQQTGLVGLPTPLGYGLKGRTLGLWGFDKTGQLMAQYAKAFGMQVMVWGEVEECIQARSMGHLAAKNADVLFGFCDAVSLHMGCSWTNRNCVTADLFASMKPSSVFINTADANLVEPNALHQALLNHRPAMAAVDVFECEPISSNHPMLLLDNCICTPHLGPVEQSAYEQAFAHAFGQLRKFIDGSEMELFNPDVRSHANFR